MEVNVCILCNCGETGDDFLTSFASSRHKMEQAKNAMLACSKVAKDQDQRKRYDHIHKEMVRLIREWNRLEEAREVS